MGSDDLHHKDKARRHNEIKRQGAKREPYDRVLIVCEDSHSTPSYLEAICDDLKLNSANLKICGKECGSAPVSVIKHAKKLKKQDTGYDKVYCVIDRDRHAKFQEALETAKSNKIDVIISIPCFEYWLLLHFAYITCPFKGARGRDCNEVIQELKKYLSCYEKGKNFLKKHYLNTLKDKQKTAIENAKKRERACQDEELENRNPFTQFHLLIEYLTALKP